MSDWHPLQRGQVLLQGRDVGRGSAVVFQHGLTASEAQVDECLPAQAGLRRLTLDCRSHGRSGGADELSIAAFADDVLAFADARGVDKFSLGGISMGAAIALRLAVLVPERVRRLVLVRPAWLFEKAPENMRPFAEVAAFLRANDRAGFEASACAQMLHRDGPDNLVSILRLFDSADREATARLVETIANDGPGLEAASVGKLGMPILVIGHTHDHVHPWATAQALAAAIPAAQLRQITPKIVSKTGYLQDLSSALSRFLLATEQA